MGFGIKDLQEDDKLTEDQEKRYHAAFKKYDTNGDGRIDSSELNKCLTDAGFGLGPLHIKMIMAFSDLDGTRTLPYQEFKHFLGRLSKIRRAFRSRDSENKGKLAQQQFAAMLKDLKFNFTDKQLKMLYPLVDRDKNGTIEEEEWLIAATFLQFAKLDFLNADIDSNGHLDKDEAKDHIHKLLGKKKADVTDAFAEKIINLVDVNKDGVLDFEEFAVMAALAKLQSK